MNPELTVLLGTAVTLGVTHTAIGIDHTLPFIVLGKARRWPLRKTLLIAAGCGVAHVLSSVAVGAIGWGLGLSTLKLEGFESGRGELAAWLLIVFGMLYAAHGLYRMRRGDGHRHLHIHADGTMHSHSHDHVYVAGGAVHGHAHAQKLAPPNLANAKFSVHPAAAQRRGIAASVAGMFPKRVWPALFILFFLGPCEALVPLMFGSAVLDPAGAWLVAGVFGVATVGTMLALVALGMAGLSFRTLSRIEPHLNWLAGAAIALSGVAVQLGL